MNRAALTGCDTLVAPKFSPSAEQELIGMELVRLGLERGRSAAQAVDVMTSLIMAFGQQPLLGASGLGQNVPTGGASGRPRTTTNTTVLLATVRS